MLYSFYRYLKRMWALKWPTKNKKARGTHDPKKDVITFIVYGDILQHFVFNSGFMSFRQRRNYLSVTKYYRTIRYGRGIDLFEDVVEVFDIEKPYASICEVVIKHFGVKGATAKVAMFRAKMMDNVLKQTGKSYYSPGTFPDVMRKDNVTEDWLLNWKMVLN